MLAISKTLARLIPFVFLLILLSIIAIHSSSISATDITFYPEQFRQVAIVLLVILTVVSTIIYAKVTDFAQTFSTLTQARRLLQLVREVSVVMLFITLTCLSFICYLLVFRTNISQQMIDSITIGDSKYILASEITDLTGIGHFNLYRCSTAGLDCQLVCQTSKMTISYLGNANTASLVLEDETIYMTLNNRSSVCSEIHDN